MNKVKTLVSIATALVLLLSVAAPVAFSDGGTITGSFTAGNAPPTVGLVELHRTNPGGSTQWMTPQQEFNVKVTVTDNNTLDNLSTVQATIFYDADGAYAPEDVPATGNTQAAAILTWTNGGTWTIDGVSGGGSWSIVSENCVLPTLTLTSGTFEFHFKPGKVAQQTTGAAKWHVYAKATDDDGLTGDNHQDGRGMNWYGDISASSSSVDFGLVNPGTDFGDATRQGPISITYISNGAYDETVRTTSTWTGSPSGTATLDVNGNPSSNKFSLKADDTATLASAKLVNTVGVVIDDSETMTSESGDTVANYLWLKLGGAFACATYNGTITYMIANGS